MVSRDGANGELLAAAGYTQMIPSSYGEAISVTRTNNGKVHLAIEGKIGILIKYIEADSERTIVHERVHERIFVEEWNKLISNYVNPYEGSYCDPKCADLAERIISAAAGLADEIARDRNNSFDESSYGNHGISGGGIYVSPRLELIKLLRSYEKRKCFVSGDPL